jgi:hypothetical protein
VDIKKAILDQGSTDQEHQDVDAVLATRGITAQAFATFVLMAKRFADPGDAYGENFLNGLKPGSRDRQSRRTARRRHRVTTSCPSIGHAAPAWRTRAGRRSTGCRELFSRPGEAATLSHRDVAAVAFAMAQLVGLRNIEIFLRTLAFVFTDDFAAAHAGL